MWVCPRHVSKKINCVLAWRKNKSKTQQWMNSGLRPAADNCLHHKEYRGLRSHLLRGHSCFSDPSLSPIAPVTSPTPLLLLLLSAVAALLLGWLPQPYWGLLQAALWYCKCWKPRQLLWCLCISQSLLQAPRLQHAHFQPCEQYGLMRLASERRVRGNCEPLLGLSIRLAKTTCMVSYRHCTFTEYFISGC